LSEPEHTNWSASLSVEEEVSLLVDAIDFHFHGKDRSDIYHGDHEIPKSDVCLSAARFFVVYTQEDGYRTASRKEGTEVDHSQNPFLLRKCESMGLKIGPVAGYPSLVANIDIGPERTIEVAIMTGFGQGSGESYEYSLNSNVFTLRHCGC
jgi:hypothetical protein